MAIKSPTADEQIAVSSSNNNIVNFLYSLGYNFGAGLIIFLIFCLLRSAYPITYSPRLHVLPKSQQFVKLPSGLFGWILPLLRTRHSDVLENCGLDSYSILRFLRLFLYLFLIFSLAVPLTLIPLHVFDQLGLSGLDSVSISNLKDKSRIWGHASIVAFVSVCFVLVVARELRLFHKVRNDYLLKQENNRTLLLTDLPKELRDPAAITLLFNCFPGGISEITTVKRTWRLTELMEQRQILITRLEVFVLKNLYTICKSRRGVRRTESTATDATLGASNKNIAQSPPKSESPPIRRKKTMLHVKPPFPTFRSKIFNGNEEGVNTHQLVPNEPRLSSVLLGLDWDISVNIDLNKREKKAIRFATRLSDSIQELTKEIQQEKEKFSQGTSAGAFVTFSTLLGARMASQSLCYPKPITVTPNVHPSNVVWENLHIKPYDRGLRVLLFKCFVAALILFWAVPVTLISSLASITTIASQFGLTFILGLPSFVLSFIQGFIPSALISLLINLLLKILLVTTKWEGARQNTDIQLSIMDKHFLFLLFNVLFVVTFANGAINSIIPIINSPPSALDVLAREMPKVATFFIIFLSFQSLVNCPLELLSPFSLAMRSIKSKHWEFYTPRGFLNQKPTIVPVWGWIWPTHTLVVTISLTYAILAPSILFFAVVYFAASYFTTLYKVVCVFQPGPQCESSGLYYVKALKQCFAGLYIAQIVAFSVILLNKQIGPTVVVFMTILFTGCVHSFCNRNYLPAIEEMSVHTVINKDPPRESTDVSNLTDPPHR
ncbi:phosphate metabolism protein 7 [Entomophthora muscae]|uniref:Phosphate metabolism protein 7 n=1 Tax=Entomophthora muscae TaxID=34485 RepID=A0ACC2TQC6_9FUNG|nr:phosphate metabolism protein 7 [Entomophthora muscae]